MRRIQLSWLALATIACTPKPSTTVSEVAPASSTPAETERPIEILDRLEALIADSTDAESDRVQAYERVKAIPDDGSVEYAFARAALAGRVAELRGAKAGKLVTEVEAYARKALEREPEFRDGEVKRMLGTLYVMAPGRLVEHGDSEEGLELLETLTDARPDDPRNHLRVAEAYVHLGDPDPAVQHLCRALGRQDALRPDERKLLTKLVEEVADAPDKLACPKE